MIKIREVDVKDEHSFIEIMQKSKSLHSPWVEAPLTHNDFIKYLNKYSYSNNISYLSIHDEGDIIGVFNLNEIVRGCLQSAYLGFYANIEYSSKGYMSKSLKLVLLEAFTKLNLHRVEANIQPKNLSSINLVSSNGFLKEGYSPRYLKINNEWCDHERWAITYEDWLVFHQKSK